MDKPNLVHSPHTLARSRGSSRLSSAVSLLARIFSGLSIRPNSLCCALTAGTTQDDVPAARQPRNPASAAAARTAAGPATAANLRQAPDSRVAESSRGKAPIRSAARRPVSVKVANGEIAVQQCVELLLGDIVVPHILSLLIHGHSINMTCIEDGSGEWTDRSVHSPDPCSTTKVAAPAAETPAAPAAGWWGRRRSVRPASAFLPPRRDRTGSRAPGRR